MAVTHNSTIEGRNPAKQRMIWFWLTLVCGLPLFIGLLSLFLHYMPEPISSHAALFLQGTQLTIVLSFAAGILGFIIGVIIGIAKLSRNILIRNFASFYVWVIRGTPLLVQILFIYYALPSFIPGLKFGDFTCAVIALALNVAAYNAEAVRAAIMAIPKEQSESAKNLGLSSFQTLRFIIFPQAFRIMLPSLTNNFVALIKDSSLASSIGLLELSLAGTRVSSETFLPVPVLATVTFVYLMFTSFVGLLIRFLPENEAILEN